MSGTSVQTVRTPRHDPPTRLLSLGLAVLFLCAGIAKLVGLEPMTAAFDRFGHPPELRLLVGAGEVVGAVGLLVPGTASWCALGLSGLMLAAIMSHLVHDPPWLALLPAVTLALLATLLWRRSRHRPVPPLIRHVD